MLFAVLTGLYVITLEEYGILESLNGWLIAIGVAAILSTRDIFSVFGLGINQLPLFFKY